MVHSTQPVEPRRWSETPSPWRSWSHGAEESHPENPGRFGVSRLVGLDP